MVDNIIREIESDINATKQRMENTQAQLELAKDPDEIDRLNQSLINSNLHIVEQERRIDRLMEYA